MLRLIPRVLILIVVTPLAALLVWYVLIFVGFAFGSPTPECMDSNTCNWWGDLFYDEWSPGFFLCLVLGAVIGWRVATIRM